MRYCDAYQMKGCRDRHRGVTLVELLVTISIIALLIALLIPAIQSARQAAHRMQCLNNLRQYGVAMNDFCSARGAFPSAHAVNGLSIHAQLLPYLDGGAAYDALNIEQGVYSLNVNPNETAYKLRLAVFICPADPEVAARPGVTSYAGCDGDGTGGSPTEATPGMFPVGLHRSIRVTAADVRDGLSNTAAICEWLVQQKVMPNSDRRRDLYSITIPATAGTGAAAFEGICRSQTGPGQLTGGTKGEPWYAGAELSTLYNHAMPINGNSCVTSDRNDIGAALTAGSLHGAGANLLLGDGHARFVRDTIAFAAWKALSTASRGDRIDGEY